MGPSNILENFRLASSIKFDGLDYGIIEEGAKFSADLDEVTDVDESVDNIDSNFTLKQYTNYSILLRTEFSIQPFVFGQKCNLFNGKKLSGDLVLSLCKFICYLEFAARNGIDLDNLISNLRDSSGNYVLDLVESAGYYYLNPETLKLLNGLSNFQYVDNLFNHFSSNVNEMFIISNGRSAVLTSNVSSKTCFAFALAYSMTIAQGLGLTEFLTLIYEAVSTPNHEGIMFIDTDGIITGNPNYTVRQYDFDTSDLSVTLNKRPTEPVSGTHYDGVVLLRFDRPSGKADGSPDHTICARYTDGHLFCEYDPLRDNSFMYGENVDHLLGRTDVIIVRPEVEVKGRGRSK